NRCEHDGRERARRPLRREGRGRRGAGRGLAALLPELRRALLEERVPAFERLVGLIVELERREAEFRDAADVLGVGVERLLGQLEGGRALLAQLAAPALGLGA